jgi:hypothetical protein
MGHTGDTYQMWDPKTGGIHVSHDITCLNQMYYKEANDPMYAELNVNPVNVQADEEEESDSSSHLTVFDKNDVEDEEEIDTVDNEEAKDTDVEADADEDDINEEDTAVTRTQSGHAGNCPRRFATHL